MSNDIVLQLDPSSHNARNSEASFVTLKSGRIVLAWSKFIGSDGSDFGHAVIASRFSDDHGKSWSSEDRVLVSQEGTTNVMSPSLRRLQDGRLALLYLRKDGDRVCLPWIRFSDDELESFSEPLQIVPEPGYCVVNNDTMIQLQYGAHRGRLLIPVCLCRYRAPSEKVALHDGRPGERAQTYMASPSLILYYFSDDGGRSWFESLGSYYRCFPSGHGIDETVTVELNDGRLWSCSRSGPIGLEGCGGRQWQAFSDDGGLTWSEPEESQFISPASPMQIKRVPQTNDLLAVWNDHSGRFKVPPPQEISWGRTPLVCAVSSDEGATWKHFKLLEDAPDHGFNYPAMHFVEDAVLFSYNAGGASSRDPLDTQRVRRISLDEIYS